MSTEAKIGVGTRSGAGSSGRQRGRREVVGRILVFHRGNRGRRYLGGFHRARFRWEWREVVEKRCSRGRSLGGSSLAKRMKEVARLRLLDGRAASSFTLLKSTGGRPENVLTPPSRPDLTRPSVSSVTSPVENVSFSVFVLVIFVLVIFHPVIALIVR